MDRKGKGQEGTARHDRKKQCRVLHEANGYRQDTPKRQNYKKKIQTALLDH